MLALAGCGGGNGAGVDVSGITPTSLKQKIKACDVDSVQKIFKKDDNTTVILAQAFQKGDSLALSGTPATPTPPTAANDLCLVKLNVGPGNPGPAGAPSTSAGIGIEVWLPTAANWNQRVHNLGGGGWAGGNQGSTTLIGSTNAAATAGTEGSVVATTDTGHVSGASGSFAMNPDGSINTTLWEDFAERSLHELALKTKELTAAYYGQTQKVAYWDGCSTGGRQGYKEVQNHPEDYDGYLNGAPAFNWTKFITNELYPQVVMQQDLGGPIATAKIANVSAAAVSACDTVNGQHLGYIPDPGQCRYDPTRDASVLCSGVAGNGVVGTSTNSACVSLTEAQAINKIWYGQTADGSYPDPKQDNGSTATLGPNQLWWGLTRGSVLLGLAGPTPFTISTDMVALELQNPSYATPIFMNATGNGMNGWKSLTYNGLANAYYQGVALQPYFGNINTDNPNLSAAVKQGVKVISYHGQADILIPTAGSINYITRVSDALGGFSQVNTFNRLFLVPGMGHCAGVGTAQGISGVSPPATANSVPLPATGQLFAALVNWVENGTAPDQIDVSSADKSVTGRLCPYPKKPTYSGSGSVTSATNYTCM